MNPDDKESRAKTDAIELQHRLYGIVDFWDDATEWYWGDPGPVPENLVKSVNAPAIPTEPAPADKK